MNPCLMVTRNALALTKAAVRSVLEQDIPTELYVIDNDSTDGTPQFLREAGYAVRVKHRDMRKE